MEVAPPSAHQRGITLIELTIALAVAAALLAMAAPSWRPLAEGSAIQAARSEMVAMLNYGRLTAARTHLPTRICPTLDDSNCSGDHTGWAEGYMLFLDDDNDGVHDPDERILRTARPQGKGFVIHSSPGRRILRFSNDGSAWGSNATLRFCSQAHPARNRGIVLYGTGRTRLTEGESIRCG